ncbi:MAG: hemerythrin domain-containing protein [Candidatus Rokubacteria bacterium]|nr:hemerythrin domain-containing protein [Candidatus Rokubacteria bacterium]
MKTPTDILREEHRIILRALDTLEAAANRIATGGSLPDGWWEQMVSWLRAFADGNHHAKEERALFPAMTRAGIPSGAGPVAVILGEHVEGLALLQVMETGEAKHRAATARRYGQLLRQRIGRENELLFPLADDVLDDQAQQALRREFDRVEEELAVGPFFIRAEAAIDRLAAALVAR